MEDGAKNISAESKGTKFLAKTGWVKKAPARLLASYKDRYVHVERTEMVVYENEDLQNCLERLDLGDYDKCHELKSPFKKKHRLVLIRSPKSGNKVSDVKFQLPNAEEKEAWMKALSDCISRAKNKIFDEVTVDESCNLEHVTRTRPKGNRNRRPPTRIHMKEVAIVSSDGILRLDLDLEDALMPNGTSHTSTDGTSSSKEVTHLPKPPSSASESTEEQSEPVSVEKALTEPEAKTPKKIPMPPIKEAKLCTTPEDESDKKKVLKPPMPPSKEAKPCLVAAGETTEKTNADMAEKSAPGDQEVDSKVDEEKEDNEREEEEPDLKTEEAALPSDGDEKPENPSDEKQLSEEISEKTTSDGTNKLQPPMVPLKPSPPSASDKTDVKNTQENVVHPTEGQSPADLPEPAPDISTHSVEESEDPLSDPISDSLSLSPALWPREKTAKAEEKSVDSGQHSDDDSEGSGSEDALAAAPLGDGPACLDVVDSEGTIQMPVSTRQAALTTKSQVRSDALSQQHSKPIPPLKPSSKTRSASFGNLLSDSPDGVQVKQPTRAEARKDMASNDDVTKLEAEVALEMEKTSKLLSTMSQSQEGEDSETTSEDLLAKAMEKLTQADHVLREVKKLKIAKNSSIRKSW